jgi:hypothetical protein
VWASDRHRKPKPTRKLRVAATVPRSTITLETFIPRAIMVATALLAFDLPHWGTSFPVLIGGSCTGLAFVVGFLLLGKRKQPLPGPRPTPADPFVNGSPSERRESSRRTGALVDVYLARPESESDPLRALVVDRSLGGLCLKTDKPVEVGALFTVRPCSASNLTPWVDIEVKHCVQEGESWRVGCRFLRTPPWGVLLLYG